MHVHARTRPRPHSARRESPHLWSSLYMGRISPAQCNSVSIRSWSCSIRWHNARTYAGFDSRFLKILAAFPQSDHYAHSFISDFAGRGMTFLMPYMKANVANPECGKQYNLNWRQRSRNSLTQITFYLFFNVLNVIGVGNKLQLLFAFLLFGSFQQFSSKIISNRPFSLFLSCRSLAKQSQFWI